MSESLSSNTNLSHYRRIESKIGAGGMGDERKANLTNLLSSITSDRRGAPRPATYRRLAGWRRQNLEPLLVQKTKPHWLQRCAPAIIAPRVAPSRIPHPRNYVPRSHHQSKSTIRRPSAAALFR